MIIVNESVLNINAVLPKSVSDFMKTDIKNLDYNIIKKAFDDYSKEYNKFPNPNSMDSLDIKYNEDKGIFYKKYYDFAKKCQQVAKLIHQVIVEMITYY